MTNSTKLIGLIMTAVLWAGVGLAHGQSTSDWGDEAPVDFTLPGASNGRMPLGTMQPSAGEEFLPAPQDYSAPAGDEYELNEECGYPGAGGLWNQVAPIESTGTWLERGFWYAEADAVIFNRVWDRNDIRFAAEDVNVEQPPINNTSLGFNPIFLATNRLLILNGSLPGRDAAVRTTLGHFLFRDSRNRDHSVEFRLWRRRMGTESRDYLARTVRLVCAVCRRRRQPFIRWFQPSDDRLFEQLQELRDKLPRSATTRSRSAHHGSERRLAPGCECRVRTRVPRRLAICAT